MKIEDVKVGMRVNYACDGHTDVGVVTNIDDDGAVWAMWEGSGYKQHCQADYLSPVAVPFPLANTKINVQKYADDNGITLATACKEIQEWLFEQGYKWGFHGPNVSPYTFRYMFTDSFAANELTHGDEEQGFEVNANKEITLQRTVAVTLTPSFVEEEDPAEPVVELNGKQYRKADLEAALAKLTPVSE